MEGEDRTPDRVPGRCGVVGVKAAVASTQLMAEAMGASEKIGLAWAIG